MKRLRVTVEFGKSSLSINSKVSNQREIKKKKTCPIVPLSKSPSKPRKLFK